MLTIEDDRPTDIDIEKLLDRINEEADRRDAVLRLSPVTHFSFRSVLAPRRETLIFPKRTLPAE